MMTRSRPAVDRGLSAEREDVVVIGLVPVAG